MRTIDHWEYAKLMMKDVRIPKPCRLAFEIGCVMPDFNKFSYMGHHVNDWTKGHSFGVRRREIIRFFEKPYHQTVLWWYLAGLKIHYLGDSFSRPHNPEFGYSSKEHVAYEWKLHDATQKLLRDIRSHRFAPARVDQDLRRWLHTRHLRYMRQTKGVEDDLYYIDSTLMGFWNWIRKNVLPSDICV